MKIIEVIADKGHEDTLTGIAEQFEIADIWWGPDLEDERKVAYMLVGKDKRQKVMDTLQTLLGASDNYRVLVLPVDAMLPRDQDEPPAEGKPEEKRSSGTSREELYAEVEKGNRPDVTYFTLVLLSAIVATVGLLEDNVAVVVGAMVIAPLLGPNLALALGTTLGDGALIRQSLVSLLTGLALALAVAVAIGLFWPVDMHSTELISRTQVGMASVVLALASGAAAVLSLTAGATSALVGVMVAVALLPPTATLGLMLSTRHWDLALNAALLLAVNIVCVNLSAKLVLMWRGVKPRTNTEIRDARLWLIAALMVWILALAALVLLIAERERSGTTAGLSPATAASVPARETGPRSGMPTPPAGVWS